MGFPFLKPFHFDAVDHPAGGGVRGVGAGLGHGQPRGAQPGAIDAGAVGAIDGVVGAGVGRNPGDAFAGGGVEDVPVRGHEGGGRGNVAFIEWGG